MNCSYIIERFKKGPANYSSIISSGVANWTDPDFQSNSSYGIIWPSPFSKGYNKNLSASPWLRLNGQFSSYKILGSEGFSNDIAQFQLGDCYFLAGVAAVATNRKLIDKVFVIKNVSNAGVYAFNFWVRGIPTIVTIDDWVQYLQLVTRKYLLFA
jgi:hypothetical protein